MTSYESIEVSRHGGIAELRFHTEGGPLQWGVPAHREAPLAFAEVAQDPTLKAVIVTGTGGVWCSDIAPGGFGQARRHELWWEGARTIQALLSIEVPVIGVLNGPGSIHAEIPMIADVVLAADDATISDAVHFSQNTVPGDGAHLVWPWLLGPRRGKYFLLTPQTISAQELLDFGVVNEIHSRDSLHSRARQIAEDFAARPLELLRYTRELLNLVERDRLRAGLSHGLALEGLLKLEGPATS